MFRILRLAVITLFVVLVASPRGSAASNGWENTSWGMTKDEVAAAISEDIALAQGKHKTTTGYEGLTAPSYEIGGCDFRAEIFFNDYSHRLENIRLELKEGNRINNLTVECYREIGELFTIKYGAPVQSTNDNTGVSLVGSREWHQNDTQILVFHMLFHDLKIGIMTIDYEPL